MLCLPEVLPLFRTGVRDLDRKIKAPDALQTVPEQVCDPLEGPRQGCPGGFWG